MENEIELEEFYVIGLSVGTTNQNSQSQRDIAVLFGNFWANAVLYQTENGCEKIAEARTK
jgi:hypothetical protein